LDYFFKKNPKPTDGLINKLPATAGRYL